MIGAAIVPAIKEIDQKWNYLIVIFSCIIAWATFFIRIPDDDNLPHIVLEWIIACFMIIFLCLYHSFMHKCMDHLTFRYENPER